MNIGELISILSEYDVELEVLVSGYELGYDAVLKENIRFVEVVDTGRESMCGRYEDWDLGYYAEGELPEKIKAVVIGR